MQRTAGVGIAEKPVVGASVLVAATVDIAEAGCVGGKGWFDVQDYFDYPDL